MDPRARAVVAVHRRDAVLPSVLTILTKARLVDVARQVETPIASSATKDAIAESLASSGAIRFRDLLQRLGRDELRAACRAHGLPDLSRSRPELMAQLLQAHGAMDSVAPAPLFSARGPRRDVLLKNDIVRCPHRQWLVEEVRRARAVPTSAFAELAHGGRRRPPPRRQRGSKISAKSRVGEWRGTGWRRRVARPARHYPEGAIAFVTDRCIDEEYLLLPDAPEVVEIIEAAWREGLRRFDVGLLVLVVMSNHWHAVVRATTSDQTAIPRFMQYVKSRVAIEINERRGRHGTFWAERYRAIPVLDDESVIDRIVYALHNPVKAGLCATAPLWPGLSTLEATTGERAACGPLELAVSLPPAWEGLDAGQLAEQRRWVRHELRAREREIAESRRARGLERPKVERVIASVTWCMRPRRPSRARAPLCFAATRGAKKAFRVMWRELMNAYRAASEKFRAGVLDAMFPASMFPPMLVRAPNEAPA